MPASDASRPPKTPTGPNKWCQPHSTFGQLTIKQKDGKRVPVQERIWSPPTGNDLVELAKFRAAVMQHVICVHVRKAKNGEAYDPNTGRPRLTQEQLAALDPRPDTQKRWNARLCGRAYLTTFDIATLMVILPGAMPSEGEVKMFMDVVEKRIEPPEWFTDEWPDKPGSISMNAPG